MATIQERLDRLKQMGKAAESTEIQRRLGQLRQIGEAASTPVQAGAGVTLPTAQQGGVLPRADESGGSGGGSVPSASSVSARGRSRGVPEWASRGSLSPLPGSRNTRMVQDEMDRVDGAIRELRGKRDALNAQAWESRSGPGSASDLQALRQQAETLDQEIARLKRDKIGLQEEWSQADEREFERLRQTPEFQTAVDKAMGAPSGLGTVNSRKPAHQDVSRAMTYFQAMARGDERMAAAALERADMALDRMDDKQWDRLAYYVGMGDYDGAADYLNSIAPALNQAQMEQVEQKVSEWSQEHPALGAAANIVSWPLNLPAYAANTRQAVKNLVTGKDEQDPHAAAYGLTKIGTGTSQGVSEAARSAAVQATGNEFAGEAASFLAGTGLSIGQNAGQIALLGPASLAGMAMSAAGSSTADALERGATPGQAFMMGSAGGAIEALTEKLPLENLFRLAKEGGGKGVKAAVVELLKQMGTEATEEMVSEIANSIVDAAVMEDDAELQVRIRELQAEGLSKKEAQRQANRELWSNVLLAGLGGGISGGVMGGGALALNQIGQRGGTAQGGATLSGENEEVATAPRAESAAQDTSMAEQAGFVEKSLRDAYEKGELSRAEYEAAVERVQAEQKAQSIPVPQEGQEAIQAPQTAQEGQNKAAPTQEADAKADFRRELREAAQNVWEEYARGEITEEVFDRAMDLLQEQAELTGMEMTQALELLDGQMYDTAADATEEGGEIHGAEEAERPDGGRLPDGDGGRLSGAGTAGEIGILGKGGPQSAVDPGRAAAERSALGQHLQAEKISSRDLGLRAGTDAETVQVMPSHTWDREMRQTARRVQQKTGQSVSFVLGGIEITGTDGRTRQVRGAFTTGWRGIIIQADNPRATPGQIADHEIFHALAQRDPGLLQAAEDAVVERFSREEFDRVVDQYIQALRGIVDVPEADGLDYVQALADVKNEVLADAYAGINAFETQTGQFQETVADTVEGRREAAPQGRENAQATDSRTGPPDIRKLEAGGGKERFSLEEFPDGKRFVDLNTDQGLFDGLSDREKTDLAVKIIRERFAGKVIGTDHPVFVNSASAREYGHPVKNIDSKIRDAKMRAAPELNNLMDAGFNRRAGQDGKDGHIHPRATGGFEYYDVIFKVGDQYFQGVINLEVNNKGRRLKDVTKIRNVTQDIYGSYGQGPKSVFLRDASDDSLSQGQADVKGGGAFFPTAEQGTAVLPKGEDFGGQERYSVDEEEKIPDGLSLPTFAEIQARKAAGDGAGAGAAAQDGGQASASVDALPRKAQDYLHRVERRLTDKVGALLSVPRSARQESLRDIVRGISAEYLSTGQVSQESRDELFERAYEQGVQVDREYYDNYKHVRDYLRTTPITVSEGVRGDITDYAAWRKGAFGTLRLVKNGGTSVDTAYMELQNMAPGLFPEDITHPADQLRHILETAKGIRVVEQHLDEAHGPDAEEFKRWARQDFDEAVADALGDLRQVKRYADERTQQAETKQTAQMPKTTQEVAALYGQMKGAHRVYQKAAARNLLTQHDQIQVGRLLRGELELEHLDPARDNVKGITEVYEAKQEYEQLAGRIRAWNQQRRAELRTQADGLLETANEWKDKKAGILYARETMERNIRDIVPKAELADEINRTYFQPVHEAAAAANRAKNEYRDRVKGLELSRKAAKGDLVSEAHAVQLLGEAEDNIRILEQGRMKQRDGKTLQEWQAVIGKLWEESPSLDQEKIREAVKEFRAIYDELFQQMNEARVRNGYEPVNYRQGYFPHFQTGDEGVMAQFGRALGIDTSVVSLPTTINGLTHTFKPGIQWFGNAQERLGFNTTYDAVEGFDRYIEGVADVIYQTDNIQRLRALGTQARYRTGDEGLRQQVDAVRARDDISEAEKQSLIDDIHEKGKFALNNFVVELDEYTNLLANKKSRSDRDMEQAAGRRMYTIMKKLEGRVAANMVAVNPASWLTNFVPLTQGAATLDRGMLLKGMWGTLKAYKTDDGLVGMSSFLTNRRGSDPIVKTWSQSASAALSSPMEYIDQFTADSLVRARFQQNLKHGMSETAAMEEADAWAAGVMADRSKGATPTLFNRSNPLTKLFTQFQLEVNNQLSYLFKDLPRDLKKKGLAALCAGLLKFFLGAYLYNEVYEYFIGRRCALDPLGILNDTVGDLTGYELPNLVEMGVGAAQGETPSFETEKKSVLDTATGLAGSVAEELPFIGGVLGGGRVPISSALPDGENLAKAALNDKWSDEKRVATAAKELGNPLTYLALPFGGGQVKKVFQALKAVHEGGSYTVDNEGNDILQYPVFNETPGDWLPSAVGAMLFGKSTLPTAREWAESGFKSFSAKQTACYQGMTELGVPQRNAYELIQEIGKVKAPEGEGVPATERAAYQKRKLLQEADISDQGKAVVFYDLLASDQERALMDQFNEGDADMGETARVLMELKDANALEDGKSAAKQTAIMESSLSEEEKNAMFRHVLGKDSKGALLSDSLEQAGLDKHSAAAVANALNGLAPEDGHKTVSDAQKWRAVMDTAKGTADQKAALLTVMSESNRMKFEIADSYGIKPEAWVQVKEALPQFDENGNGSYSGGEIENAIDALAGDGRMLAPWDKDPIRLSREEKAVLWQLFTGSKSGSGNPYSMRVGKKVAEELEKAKG